MIAGINVKLQIKSKVLKYAIFLFRCRAKKYQKHYMIKNINFEIIKVQLQRQLHMNKTTLDSLPKRNIGHKLNLITNDYKTPDKTSVYHHYKSWHVKFLLLFLSWISPSNTQSNLWKGYSLHFPECFKLFCLSPERRYIYMIHIYLGIACFVTKVSLVIHCISINPMTCSLNTMHMGTVMILSPCHTYHPGTSAQILQVRIFPYKYTIYTCLRNIY